VDSKRRGTSAAPAQASGARSAARGLARPGGLAVGETYTHEDGLKIRVDRLGLLPRVPPKSIFEEKNEYVASEAVRFEVTVTNDGEKAGSLSDLSIGVRSGADGRQADESWSGTKVLRGKLLPGASATGPTPTACSPGRRE
jgi:hypothetical protein